MAKKIELKTKKNNSSPAAFINGLTDEQLKADCKKLIKVFKQATRKSPKMWGPSIIGFGEYTYHRSNGDEGQFLETGFSPRKNGPVIYVMPGYKNYGPLLKKLGPHKKAGISCLHFKNLEEVDLKVLKTLIERGVKDLKKIQAAKSKR